MKLIVITTPGFFEGEADAITSLFRAGLEILHLRKPGASAEEIEHLLHQIPAEFMQRIVTHEQFGLATTFDLKGIHLNGRNPEPPLGYKGHVSCSCHSLEEVVQRKNTCNYVFLSPIYNSISKEGYASAFSYDNLKEAQQAGIIDSKVMALGGISRKHFAEIESLGFGGVVLLGDIWQRIGADFISHFSQLKQLSSKQITHH